MWFCGFLLISSISFAQGPSDKEYYSKVSGKIKSIEWEFRLDSLNKNNIRTNITDVQYTGSSVLVMGETSCKNCTKTDLFLFVLDKKSGKYLWSLKGIESRVAGDEVLYVCTAEKVLAFDTQSGNQHWELTKDKNAFKNAFKDVFVKDNFLFAITSKNEVYEIDKKTGKVISRKKFHSKYPAYKILGLTKDKLFLKSEDHIHAINREKGKELWRFKGTEEIWILNDLFFAVNNIKVDDGKQKIMSEEFINALDIHTGRLVWQVETRSKISKKLGYHIKDERLYFVTDSVVNENREIFHYYLVALDPANGKTAWKTKLSGRYKKRVYESQPEKIHYIGNIYVACKEGSINGFNAYTGEKIWSKEMMNGVSSIKINGDVLFLSISNPARYLESPYNSELISIKLGGRKVISHKYYIDYTGNIDHITNGLLFINDKLKLAAIQYK